MKLVLLFLFTTKKIGIERLVNDKAGTEFRLSGSRDRSFSFTTFKRIGNDLKRLIAEIFFKSSGFTTISEKEWIERYY